MSSTQQAKKNSQPASQGIWGIAKGVRMGVIEWELWARVSRHQPPGHRTDYAGKTRQQDNAKEIGNDLETTGRKL